jgi:hypothetical protein
MAVADEREPEPNRYTLHQAHLVALRAGPYFLGVLGLCLLIAAVFATKSDALSITMLILGGTLSIAAATVTRADELKMTKDGIEAKMSSIAGLDRASYAVTFRAAEPLSVGKPQISNSTTVAELIAAAPAAGWIVAETTGTSHVTLTKLIRDERPGFVRGDVVTVSVPTDSLLSPVPMHVLRTLSGVGFDVPSNP